MLTLGANVAATIQLVIETNGPVKTLWMNRPEKRNALDSEMLHEMTDVLRPPAAFF